MFEHLYNGKRGASGKESARDLKSSTAEIKKVSKKGFGIVEPFLQKKDPEFVSPIDVLVKQKKLILDENIPSEELIRLLGSLLFTLRN